MHHSHRPWRHRGRVLFWIGAVLLQVPFAQTVPRRIPLDAGPVTATPVPSAFRDLVDRRLIIKLADPLVGRAQPDGTVESRIGAPLTGLHELSEVEGLSFQPLIRTSESRLRDLEQRAARLSGRQQPDLASLLTVMAPDEDVAELVRLGNLLRELDEVEFAYLQTLGAPPPADIPPLTSDLSPNQVYLGPDPGFDVMAAEVQGWTGAGIRFSDCEYGWNLQHEDLVDQAVVTEPGQTIHPSVFAMGWDDHGTSVLGVTSAGVNGYGMNGIAADASVFAYPEWSVEEGPRRATCVANALSDSQFGDVVLLEMQAFGPGGGLAPAEVDPAIFMLVKTATDAGVVVVAAAGNGAQNLDSAPYFAYRQMGDSGAIMVGAGSADIGHDRLSFSTFGSRVNVQGWGELVVTLGGSWLTVGGDPDQAYSNSFSGTSSAASIIGGLCCVLQEAAVATGGQRLPPRDLRLLLASTGLPSSQIGGVGTAPQMAAALKKLPSLFLPRWEDLGGGTAGSNGIPQLIGEGDLTPNAPLTLTLVDGAPSNLALVWLSGGTTPTSFIGGTLHAWPFFAQILVALDSTGSVSGTVLYPPGQPAGTKIWYQIGVVDAAVPGFGGALSNAIVSTSP